MTVDLVIGNLYSRIHGQLPLPVRDELIHRLTYTLKDSQYMINAMNMKRRMQAKKLGIPFQPVKEWDGKVNLFWPERDQSFYTGMMTTVTQVLAAAKIKYQLVDKRERPPQNLPNLVFHADPVKYEYREYQDLTIAACQKATRGIIQAATGSGKTFMVTRLIGELKTAPFLFLVLSTDLMDQAYVALMDCLNVPIGRVGDGACDIQNITVMTVQTAIRVLNRNNPKFRLEDYKYDEDDSWKEQDTDIKTRGDDIERLIRSAKGVYFDEVHHAASRVCKEVLLAAKDAYWRFGGSATPFREDGQEMMIQALFGKHLVEITPSWLIRHDYLVKPYIFNVHLKNGDNGKHFTYARVYKECIVNNDELNKLSADLVQFFEDRGISSLCLVKQYDHGHNIQAHKSDLAFIKGDMAKTKRKNSIQGLRDGDVQSAIATTLADEGLDVRRLGCVIVAGGGKSITRVYQRIGRVLRKFKGKDKVFAIVFHHDGRYLHEHGRKVKNMLKKEDEFVIRDSTPETIFSDISAVLDGSDLFDVK